MKKLLLLSLPFFGLMFFGLIFSSCEEFETIKTTYQVYNNSESYSSDVDPYLNGSMYEVVVFCFAGNDVVREDNYKKIAIGEKTKMKDVPESVTKIKVSFKFLPKESAYYDMSSNNRKYVVSYTLIEKGKNVVAEINENSMVGSSLVKEQSEGTFLKSIKQNF